MSRARRLDLACIALLFTLPIALLRDGLFDRGRALSTLGLDASAQYLPWRAFGFRELAHGNLPLWNPHAFSGAPFFGNFQVALLYPPNWLHLVLPDAVALGWTMALHVGLAGVFTYLFCRQRGLGPTSSLVGGLTFSLSGPYFFHLFAGHAPYLAALTWTPLIFLVEDRLVSRPTARGALGLAAIVAMQVHAGYPQPMFYGAVAAGAWLVLRWREMPRPRATLTAFAAGWLGGLAIGAAQLVAGAAATRASWRIAGTSRSFAASFSLPPENLLTMIVPGAFGDETGLRYFGGELWWEASAYVGAVAFVLAAFGIVHGDRARRRWLVPLALASVLFALGSHTPLFDLVYRLPGFGTFRAPARAIHLTAFFAAVLAAQGHDALGSARPRARSWLVATFGLAALLAIAAAFVLALGRGGEWPRVVALFANARRVFLLPAVSADPAFLAAGPPFVATQLAVAAALVAVAGVLVTRAGRHPLARAAIVVLVAGELAFFAARSVTTFEPLSDVAPPVRDALRRVPPEERVLDPDRTTANSGPLLGVSEVGGYDPLAPRRYGQAFRWFDGRDPDGFIGSFEVHRPSPLLPLLRCRTVLLPEQDGGVVRLPGTPMPQVSLVGSWKLSSSRDEAFRMLADPAFDPRATVLLERAPTPEPEPAGARGSVRVIAQRTDEIEIEADVPAPALLLVTDAYDDGWRAEPIGAGPQPHYEVLAADWLVRAVPLAAGRHRLRMEYRPRGWKLGVAVSLASLVAWLVAAAVLSLRAPPTTTPRASARSPRPRTSPGAPAPSTGTTSPCTGTRADPATSA